MRRTEVTVTNDGRLQVDAPYHAEIVARLKALGGEWDKERKTWYIRASLGDRLLDALPKASYCPDALEVCYGAPASRTHNFATGLIALGLRLGIDARTEEVFVEGNVSPEIERLVAERADDLRAWLVVNDGAQRPGLRPVVWDVEPDPRMELIQRGMVNAHAAEERGKARAMQARKPRRRMLEQAELALGK